MKENSSSTTSTSNQSIVKPPHTKGLRNNIIDLHFNENLKDFLKETEFKEFKLNQKQEYAKNEDSDMNILSIDDLDLRDALKTKEFPDRDFNIVNSFLKIEEEEILNAKNNFNNKNTNNEKDLYMKNKKIQFDEEDSTLNQVNNRLFKDDGFQPGLFTSFDFKDRIKSIINSSFNTYGTSDNLNLLNKMNDKNSSESNKTEEEEIKITHDINDSFILDTCFTDKDITYDNIVINFDKDIKKEDTEASISENKKLFFECFKKSEAIPEYENQIISYQNLNHIEKQESIEIYPEHEELFNRNLFEYFVKVSKGIKDEGLKNKVKLILKLILYKDPKTKKYIFDNKVKNQLLNYWKEKYQKELSEATFREKSKILKEKYDNANPNNKLFEMGKRLQERRKANLKKGAYFWQKSSNHLLLNSKFGERKLYKRFGPIKNKSIGRRFSADVKKSNNK